MSKRNYKHTTPIRFPADYIQSGECGDVDIDVAGRRFVELTVDGMPYPIELNAWEAHRLGRALIKAARQMDGGR